jgi:hypothetical protein
VGQQHRKERTHQARCLRIEIYEGKEKSCLRVGLNRAQMAQTGKAGAVRLCTYRRPELGPHLLMRTLARHLDAASHHPSKPAS